MSHNTLTVLIGNSDDKLAQDQWSEFCADVDNMVRACAVETFFKGFAPGDAKWQNGCWVALVAVDLQEVLAARLKELVSKYGQEAIAVIVGKTTFITP